MKTLIVIPCRLKSTRLPEKVIKPIHGLEMILWVARRIGSITTDFIVAIDDDKIAKVLDRESVPYMMTSVDHASGTARVAEVAMAKPDFDFFCNVQGDEPLIDPTLVQNFIASGVNLSSPYVQAITSFQTKDDLMKDSTVKAVVSRSGRLIYCSRLPIPFDRDDSGKLNSFKVCGLYLFSKNFLEKYNDLEGSDLENLEKIEQLKCLENDIEIDTVKVDGPMFSVDTEQDLISARIIPKSEYLAY